MLTLPLGKAHVLPRPQSRSRSQPRGTGGGVLRGGSGAVVWLTHRAHTHQPAADTAPGAQDQEPVLVRGEGVLHDVALLQEAGRQEVMPLGTSADGRSVGAGLAPALGPETTSAGAATPSQPTKPSPHPSREMPTPKLPASRRGKPVHRTSHHTPGGRPKGFRETPPSAEEPCQQEGALPCPLPYASNGLPQDVAFDEGQSEGQESSAGTHWLYSRPFPGRSQEAGPQDSLPPLRELARSWAPDTGTHMTDWVSGGLCPT